MPGPDNPCHPFHRAAGRIVASNAVITAEPMTDADREKLREWIDRCPRLRPGGSITYAEIPRDAGPRPTPCPARRKARRSIRVLLILALFVGMLAAYSRSHLHRVTGPTQGLHLSIGPLHFRIARNPSTGSIAAVAGYLPRP